MKNKSLGRKYRIWVYAYRASRMFNNFKRQIICVYGYNPCMWLDNSFDKVKLSSVSFNFLSGIKKQDYQLRVRTEEEVMKTRILNASSFNNHSLNPRGLMQGTGISSSSVVWMVLFKRISWVNLFQAVLGSGLYLIFNSRDWNMGLYPDCKKGQ